MQRQVVVPYATTNATVRARAVHWIDRLVAAELIAPSSVAVSGPGFGSRNRGSSRGGADVLLLRNIGRFTRGRPEQRLLRRAALGVYDLDDGLPWDDGRLPGLGRWWKRPWPRSLVARRAACAADRLIVGNDQLAEWATQWCNDVVVIPTCVEPGEYARRSDWHVPSRPTIGWVGSPATSGYLRDIEEPLREVCRRTGARIEAVGAAASELGPLADIVDVVAWEESDALGRIATWDVGVMPLRDGIYERAKCGYKLLQYAAAGIPVVASPVGVNLSIISSMDGLAPESGPGWADALVEVLEDSNERRAERALAGFALAEDYSFSNWQTRWVDAVGWLR